MTKHYMRVGVSGPASCNDFFNVGSSSSQYPTDSSNCQAIFWYITKSISTTNQGGSLSKQSNYREGVYASDMKRYKGVEGVSNKPKSSMTYYMDGPLACTYPEHY